MRGLVVLALVCACRRNAPVVDAGVAASSPQASSPSEPRAGAAAAAPTVTAGDATAEGAAAQIRIVDAPAWPTVPAPATLQLTWAQYPSVPRMTQGEPDPEKSAGRLELVARIGSVTRRIDLGRPFGMLDPREQGACNPAVKSKGTLALISFYHGGTRSFEVRAAGPDAVDVVEVYQTDGACLDSKGNAEACPADERAVARIPVPAGYKATERILLIEGPGREAPLACSP